MSGRSRCPRRGPTRSASTPEPTRTLWGPTASRSRRRRRSGSRRARLRSGPAGSPVHASGGEDAAHERERPEDEQNDRDAQRGRVGTPSGKADVDRVTEVGPVRAVDRPDDDVATVEEASAGDPRAPTGAAAVLAGHVLAIDDRGPCRGSGLLDEELEDPAREEA